MAISRISGNQIATSTEAIITTLSFLNQNSVFRLPSGTEANKPTGVSVGTLRFNTDNDSAEIYKADDGTGSAGWTEVAGGGPSVGNDAIIRTNGVTLSENTVVGPTANGDEKFTHGFHHGDLTISGSNTLTIENNATLQIIDGAKQVAYQQDTVDQFDYYTGQVLQVIKGPEVDSGGQTPANASMREIFSGFRTTITTKSTNPLLRVTFVCNGELDGTMVRAAMRFYWSKAGGGYQAGGRPMFFGSPSDTNIEQACDATVENMFPITAPGGTQITVTPYWASEGNTTANIHFGQTWSQFGNVPMASFLIVEEIKS